MIIEQAVKYSLLLLFTNIVSFVAFQTYFYQVLCYDNPLGELLLEPSYWLPNLLLGGGSPLWWTISMCPLLLGDKGLVLNLDWFTDVYFYNSDSSGSIYCVFFSTQVMPSGEVGQLKFSVLQQKAYGIPGELILAFFRLVNYFPHDIHGVTIYNVSPHELSIYLVKLQCFCFEEINIKSGESIDLPVLLYLDKKIQFDILPLKFLVVEYTLLWNYI